MPSAYNLALLRKSVGIQRPISNPDYPILHKEKKIIAKLLSWSNKSDIALKLAKVMTTLLLIVLGKVLPLLLNKHGK